MSSVCACCVSLLLLAPMATQDFNADQARFFTSYKNLLEISDLRNVNTLVARNYRVAETVLSLLCNQYEFEPTEVEEKNSWIEIEMVDEADQPWAGEPYEIKTPSGKIRKGTLDAKGFAHISGLEPGTCQICFPYLDEAAWERI